MVNLSHKSQYRSAARIARYQLQNLRVADSGDLILVDRQLPMWWRGSNMHGVLKESEDGLQLVTYPEPLRGWVLMELAITRLSPIWTLAKQACVAHDERKKRNVIAGISRVGH